MATPREVIKSLALDFKRRDMNYMDVAKLTGYKAQTIANIISSQQKYFCAKQALRFSDAFGYNKDYLMTGNGQLSDSGQLAEVMSTLSRYIYLSNDPTLLELYNRLTERLFEKH